MSVIIFHVNMSSFEGGGLHIPTWDMVLVLNHQMRTPTHFLGNVFDFFIFFYFMFLGHKIIVLCFYVSAIFSKTFHKFFYSDFFFIFSESSETYADSSLNKI